MFIYLTGHAYKYISTCITDSLYSLELFETFPLHDGRLTPALSWVQRRLEQLRLLKGVGYAVNRTNWTIALMGSNTSNKNHSGNHSISNNNNCNNCKSHASNDTTGRSWDCKMPAG